MPYVVLARRGRPQLFADVVGQEHVTQTLQNAISSNRIAHAYIFSGSRGVGKTTVARIFAKAVNCKENSHSEPCNKCNTCVEISSGRSMDVIEIDAASNRGIDEIRELRENVKFAPVSGKYKVYIIDEAHMLTPEAFNALLKTLEEPPGHVIFILATTESHKIPATILSRCQRFIFRMLPRKEIVNSLKRLLNADNISADDEALSMIAESADGSMRDALSILEQILSFGDGKLRGDDVSKFLGLGAFQLLGALAGNILQNDSAKSLESLNTLADYGADLTQCLKKLVSYFRDLMFYKINPGLVDASETKLQELAEQSKDVSIERLMKNIRILTQTESDIKQLGYERLNFEMALIRLSRLRDDTIPLAQVLGKLEEIESKLYSGAVEIPKIVAEPEYAESVINEAEVKEESDPLSMTWASLLKSIRSKHQPSLYAFLKEASPISIEDGSLIIDFGPKFNWHREQIEEDENKKPINAELSQIMGKPMILKIRPRGSPDSAENPGEAVPSSQIEKKRDAMQDKTVQMVLSIFDGRIIEVK